MGKVFREMADEALVPSELEECQHYGCENAVGHDFNAHMVDPAPAGIVAPGQTDFEIFAAERAQAFERHHRIPEIPLMLQQADWVLCRGDFLRVPRQPEELRRVGSGAGYISILGTAARDL